MSITYSDEHIDYWGDVYINKRLKEFGINFEMFLQFPADILAALFSRDFKPLLPAQRRAAAQVRHDEAMNSLQKTEENKLDKKHAVCRNGIFMEPLHHSRFPRKAPRWHSQGKK